MRLDGTPLNYFIYNHSKNFFNAQKVYINDRDKKIFMASPVILVAPHTKIFLPLSGQKAHSHRAGIPEWRRALNIYSGEPPGCGASRLFSTA